MLIGKKEKLMLIILGILVYILIMVKFILIPIIPEIRNSINNININQKEITSLDKDMININQKKLDISNKTLNNERLEAYLLQYADLPYGIEFINKLSNYFGELNGIIINEPQEKTTSTSLTGTDNSVAGNGSKFYEMKISFTVKLTYSETFKLINYFEGSSMKIRIEKFSMESSIDNKLDKDQKTIPIKKTVNDKFNINMTICLYSLNKEASDKLYNYSRNKLNRFDSNDAVLFIPAIADSSFISTKPKKNIVITENSFLAAGPNLEIYGFNSAKDFIKIKTKRPQSIILSFTDNSYSIEATDDTGKAMDISGDVPENDIGISVSFNLTQIAENEDLSLNIKLINKSSKKIDITLDDNEKRAIITDRNGSQINGNSSLEKTNIF